MSYCVNCGVKLEASLKKCPLCETPVINPKKIISEEITSAYPNTVESLEIREVDWKYVTKLSLIILFFLGMIAVICDVFTTGGISWSLYVICSVGYFGCHLSFIHFKNIYIPIIIEIIGSEFFILLIAMLNNGMHWYLYLVMPFILIVGLYMIIFIFMLRRKNKNTLRTLSLSLFLCGGALILIECLIDLYIKDFISLYWSIYAVLPIAIICIILFGLSYNKKLIEEIKQRIFI